VGRQPYVEIFSCISNTDLNILKSLVTSLAGFIMKLLQEMRTINLCYVTRLFREIIADVSHRIRDKQKGKGAP